MKFFTSPAHPDHWNGSIEQIHSICAKSSIIPFDLELDLLGTAFALVFNTIGGAHWRVDALTRDLDFELLSGLDAVGQAAQLGYKFFLRVGFLDITFRSYGIGSLG